MSSNIPIPIQPNDPKDEVYQLIFKYTSRGDYKVFAQELGVSLMAVSYVVRGMRRNERIWKRVIQEVMKRKQERETWVKYMKTGV